MQGSDDVLVLVANRDEVALRVVRAVADLGWRSCAVFADEDAGSLPVRRADLARPLDAGGVAAYLDVDRLLGIADEVGADLLHPGYGFLSEDAGLARRCADAGVGFVGPSADVLEKLGDKLAARRLAVTHDVPVAPGSDGPVELAEARAFLASLDGAPMVIKAVAGGGGRGMRPVADETGLAEAFERCRSEARAAFGSDALYVERLIPRARHVEVQIAGDGDQVTHLGERDCSLQRRHQKLIEIAPAPGLDEHLRDELTGAAVRMAEGVGYSGLGTFEFLVDVDTGDWVFMEANPRLQVEHTVTEECAGIDLVRSQLRLATGATLAEIGLGPTEVPALRGTAVQARVNLETVERDGSLVPSSGTLTAFQAPTGPGVRTDTAGYVGYRSRPAFDTLLAKVVAHAPDRSGALRRTDRALGEFHLEGPDVNLGLLRAILRHPDVLAGRATTRFVDEHLAELLDAAGSLAPGPTVPPADADEPARPGADAPAGTVAIDSPVHGTVVALRVGPGDVIGQGASIAVLEAMKMEHPVPAPSGGVVRGVSVAVGDTVPVGAPLVFIERTEAATDLVGDEELPDPDHIRPDLAEVLQRRASTRDETRDRAVAKRREQGRRTARENIDDLVDPGSFVEYGGLVIAAQRQRRSEEELIERTPADGLVSGIGRVNGDRFGDEAARCAVLSYDYTVLAGTQGTMNHAKKDRLFELIRQLRLPVVLFAEGGGGRPGDTDTAMVSGLHTMAFALFAELSGLVPSVGIVSGYCFAGNAALLGCCDVIIATRDSNIGMGGPAMIEGGGLGRYGPTEIGPIEVQGRNGVVDLVVGDEAEAVAVAKRYLSYFQGPVDDWEAPDQRTLRHLVPEDRRRVYDVRRVVHTLADTDSVLELRRGFGPGMVTAFVRIEGRPVGLVANDPTHLGGAIDRDGADKMARFLQLCDAFDLPVVSLCDTPGFMVGPEAEETAQVRHFARMFVAGASLSVPYLTVVLRKGYGLGAQAMAAGSFHAPLWTVSWPTGEFGGMNLEGAVRLGFRRELDAVEDPEEREELFEQMVGLGYEHGKALNVATYFEIDDVIDPAETRARIVDTLRAVPAAPPRTGKKRPSVDTW